jgi:hypothetical protein
VPTPDDAHRLMARFRRDAEYDAIVRAVGAGLEADDAAENPLPPGSAPADPWANRGVPIVSGRGGLGGATLGSVPHRDAPSLRRRATR